MSQPPGRSPCFTSSGQLALSAITDRAAGEAGLRWGSKRSVYITHAVLIIASIIAVYPLISIVRLGGEPVGGRAAGVLRPYFD